MTKIDSGPWPHPARLPLGAGWKGQCAATSEQLFPNDEELEKHCNLGYAKCEHIPAIREADALRFSIAAASDSKIVVKYACERQYRPAECGTLEFNRHQMQWTTQHPNTRLQKMAECFLRAYLDGAIR